MVLTPTKRHASRSPDGDRPNKRAITSSPEEGEVDDASPPLATQPFPSSLPAKPLPALKTKVPFPFKKKSDVPSGPQSRESQPPVVYERSEEDERKIREADLQRRANRAPGDLIRRPRLPVGSGDHWEPGYSRPNDRLPREQANGRQHYNSSERDRDSFMASGSRDNDRGRGYGSKHDGIRDRSKSSPSSARSRTPSSQHSNPREKHRLPPPRSPEASFSPPRRDYGVDRIRDREREHGGWDRGRDRDPRRYPDDDDDRSYSRPDDRYHPRDWPQQTYSKYPDDDSRYWRPGGDSRSTAPRDDRAWTRREEYYDLDRRDRSGDHDRYYRPHYDSNSPRRSNHPASPLPLPPRPSSALGPRTPSPGPRTPPPPASSPPPPPPPPEQILPPDHSILSIPIPLKKPPAPRGAQSPPSLPLPPALPEAKQDLKVEEPVPNKVVVRRKPEPIRRSRKEEELAYGRFFIGCGQQSDYEVTTKLGEGTFGEVHKAIHKATGRAVALKRILMHNEKEGMPVTALREIKILKALNHPCIVNILDMFVVRSNAKDPLSVYMVFPYMDHDLAGLLENERVKLQPSQVKLYMKQLLEGTEYMHRNHILHRDMKAANLLISNSGSLRIADFGLARAFDATVARGGDSRVKERRYTNCVVTRWYRPPELLLGARQYGGEVDMWGIGCVLGEMFNRRPILAGTSDLDQLDKIWQLCGSPNQHNWPNYDALPGCEGVKRFSSNYSRKVRQAYESVGPEMCDLLDKLLVCNPRERITASQALDHDYFWTDPLPADPKTLPSYEASHEFDRRGRRPQPPPGQHQIPGDGHFRPPPPMGQHLPMHFGRGGPPREAFHTGPPPPYPRGGPPHPYPPHHHPNQHQPPYPPPQSGPPPPSYPHRMSQPPYRPPYHGSNRGDRWEPQNRPPHLPPRPDLPMGRGGPPRGGGGRGNGNRTGDSTANASGGGELNYG